MNTTNEIRKTTANQIEDTTYQNYLKGQARNNVLNVSENGDDPLAIRAEKRKYLSQQDYDAYRRGNLPATEEPAPITVNQTSEPVEEAPTNTDTGLNVNEGNNAPAENNAEAAKISSKKLPDPDFGHYDNDKIKLSDGDFIDYLMREWLLEGAAWCLNELGGIGGALFYELARSTHRGVSNVKTGTMRAVREGFSNFYNNTLNRYNESVVNNLNDIRSVHNQSVHELSGRLHQLSSETIDGDIDNFAHINRGIGKRHIIKQDDKFIDITSNPPQEISLDPRVAAQYEQIRLIADKVHIDSMRKALNIPEGDKKSIEQISKVYEELVKRESNQAYDEALVNANPKLEKAFNRVRTEYNNSPNSALLKAKVMLSTQADLFAEHYSQYRLETDASIRDKDKGFLTAMQLGRQDGKYIKDLKMKEYNKALNMYWQIQKARLNGNKNLPSNETLIGMAKNQLEASTDKVAKDVIKEDIFKKMNVKNEKPLNLENAAKAHVAVIGVLENNLSALEREEKATQFQKDYIEHQRQQVERIKEELSNGNSSKPSSQKPQPNKNKQR